MAMKLCALPVQVEQRNVHPARYTSSMNFIEIITHAFFLLLCIIRHQLGHFQSCQRSAQCAQKI